MNGLQVGDPLLLASGTININTHSVTRNPWYVLESGSWKPAPPGEYELALLDSGGVVLNSYPFEAGGPVDGVSHFLLKVPYPASTARIQIKKDNAVIDDFTPSSQAPHLAITAPSAGAIWSGAQTIAWTSGDGDGNPLYFIVYLSTDGGASWETANMDLQGNSLILDTRRFNNSFNCLIKIAASDGLRTAIQTAGPFSIRNPLRILGFSPGSNQTSAPVRNSVLVEFSEAVNPGTGNVALPPGVHVLSLSFSRQDIQAHGVEGPYYFADGYLVDLSYSSSNAMLATPYLTRFTNGTLAGSQSTLVSIAVTPREKGWVQFQASVTSVQDSYVANNNQQLLLEIGMGNNVVYLPLVMKP